jgi:hypothetical protein
MVESGRIPVPLRLCWSCRRFVNIDGHEDCVFCGCDLDSAQAEHEDAVGEMHWGAEALREGLAEHSLQLGTDQQRGPPADNFRSGP